MSCSSKTPANARGCPSVVKPGGSIPAPGPAALLSPKDYKWPKRLQEQIHQSVVCMLYRTLVRQGEGAHWSQQTKSNKHMQEKEWVSWLRSAVKAVTLKKESDVFLKYEAGFRLSEVTSGLTSGLTLSFTVDELLHSSHRHSKSCSGAESVQINTYRTVQAMRRFPRLFLKTIKGFFYPLMYTGCSFFI